MIRRLYRSSLESSLLRVDGFYLYKAGLSIHPIEQMRAGESFQEWVIPLLIARGALYGLVRNSVFQLKTCRVTGEALLEALNNLLSDMDRDTALEYTEAYAITSALSEFEHVLTAELGMVNLYLVTKKRGYDTDDLIHFGYSVFPPDLSSKVPESISDVMAGTKCIAFELPTAAGFHLHRANESVLRRYFDQVSSGAPRPERGNMGDYLNELSNNSWGEAPIRSALRDSSKICTEIH
jgi:hypothetical protein